MKACGGIIYFFIFNLLFIFAQTLDLSAQALDKKFEAARRAATSAQKAPKKPKFPDKYSSLDKPQSVKIITDELINNTIEAARQSYMKGLISIGSKDTLDAIKYFETALTKLNTLTIYPEVDTNADYNELLENVLTNYNDIAKKSENIDFVISPKDRLFQQDSNSTAISVDSLSDNFTRPPSADTSENYIFSIPKIDDLKIPLFEHQAIEEQIALLTKGQLKAYMPRWIERSSKWFPLMKDIANRESMPAEILLLTFIESGLNPVIESPKAAVGLWQFLYATGMDYGLNKRQSIWVDERRDPEKSTRAALRYLRDLYLEFNDWYLALNAYNWGWGNVGRALKQCNKENPTYWDIRNQKNISMPAEARNYVPLFLAILKITSDPEKYGIDVTKLHYEPEFKFDIVEIEQPSNLSAIAQVIGVQIDKIKELNPELLYDITPADRKYYRLRVPPGTHAGFSEKFALLPDATKQPSLDYIAKKGETIVSIAEKFDVAIDHLISLNSLNSNTIVLPDKIGLRIPIGGKTFSQSNLIQSDNKLIAKAEALSSNSNFHITTKDETVYHIAEKYNLNPADIRNWNQLPIDQDIIKEGKAVIISQAEAEKQAGTSGKSSVSSATDLKDMLDSNTPQTITTLTHTVKKGETLYKIARQYDITENLIKELNPSIKNDIIHPNAVLIVSTKASVENNKTSSVGNNSAQKQSTSKSQNKQKTQYHTVVSGDSLTKIARKYRTNINNILSLNRNLKVKNILSLGQKIRIK